MAPSHAHSSDATVQEEKSIATLAELRVGVKAWVQKGEETRKAEILSIQTRKGAPSFYVHYVDFNKRLDEWVSSTRIDLSQEVEWPTPPKPETKKAPGKALTDVLTSSKANKAVPKNQKRVRALASREQSVRGSSGTPELSSGKGERQSRASGKENRDDVAVISTEVIDGTPQPEDEEANLVDVQDAAAAAKAAAPEVYTREEEIEKLRTSGSMTQNQTEVNRIRNLSKIQMGEHEIEPWYFSPYPPETVQDADPLYICEFCLSFFPSYKQFTQHRSKCSLLHPPGNEIYRDDEISFFEIDGARQLTWCRHLCLLSKLFLDHKTLYYDVDPFLFYCMCTRDSRGYHLVGYFSKEKTSQDNYNVACILTLPQYQRRGFGRLLVAFSYELSRREQKQGSPEKPLSDLGLLGYRAYWAEVVVDLIVDKKHTSIEDIAVAAAMTTDDVIHTLQNLNMLRIKGNQHVIVLTNAVLAQREKVREKQEKKGKRVIDPDKLIWKPFQSRHRLNRVQVPDIREPANITRSQRRQMENAEWGPSIPETTDEDPSEAIYEYESETTYEEMSLSPARCGGGLYG